MVRRITGRISVLLVGVHLVGPGAGSNNLEMRPHHTAPLTRFEAGVIPALVLAPLD